MKRLFVLSILCAACDPFLSIDATVIVTPEVQDVLTYPQEVVVDFGTNLGLRRAFVLCEASDQDITINVSHTEIGCASTTTVRAWAAHFIPAEGEEVVCGDQPNFTDPNSIIPLDSDPRADEIIFTKIQNVLFGCAGGSAAVDLTLSF
jgi:hypothetical protein